MKVLKLPIGQTHEANSTSNIQSVTLQEQRHHYLPDLGCDHSVTHCHNLAALALAFSGRELVESHTAPDICLNCSDGYTNAGSTNKEPLFVLLQHFGHFLCEVGVMTGLVFVCAYIDNVKELFFQESSKFVLEFEACVVRAHNNSLHYYYTGVAHSPFLKSSGQMQITNKFWKESFNREVVVDWDDFMNSFSAFTERFSKIVLDPGQKNFLKNIIDPDISEQVNMGQFFSFLDKYWIIPSNRTNVFKHKFKPVVEPKTDEWRGLAIKTKSEEEALTEYTYKRKTLKKGQNSKLLLTKNFLRIGSSEANDLRFQSIYINEFHLKIIMVGDQFYIRDTSKSNRVKFKIDRPVLLKKGMVLSLGDHQIIVKSVQNGQQPSNKLCFFMDLDMSSLSSKSIYKKYGIVTEESVVQPLQQDEGEYGQDYDKSQKIIQGQIQIEVIHTQTRQSKAYTLQKASTIGKSPTSNIQLLDIKVPSKACTIDYGGQIWTLKVQPNADVTVYLANNEQIRNNISSNRQSIQDGCTVITKDLQMSFQYLQKPEQY